MFSADEVMELRFLMESLETGIGHEEVIKAAYPISCLLAVSSWMPDG